MEINPLWIFFLTRGNNSSPFTGLSLSLEITLQDSGGRNEYPITGLWRGLDSGSSNCFCAG